MPISMRLSHYTWVFAFGLGFRIPLGAFTQNNVLQHIYSVGKTFTVLALRENGDAKNWYRGCFFVHIRAKINACFYAF